MSCDECKHYTALIKPRQGKDKDGHEYAVYGYCFRKMFQEPYCKGYAVFLPEGECKHVLRQRNTKAQRMEEEDQVPGQMRLEAYLDTMKEMRND